MTSYRAVSLAQWFLMGHGTSSGRKSERTEVEKENDAKKIKTFGSITDSSTPEHQHAHQQKAAFKIQTVCKDEKKNPQKEKKHLPQDSLQFQDLLPEAEKPPLLEAIGGAGDDTVSTFRVKYDKLTGCTFLVGNGTSPRPRKSARKEVAKEKDTKKIKLFGSIYLRHTDSSTPEHQHAHQQQAAFKIQTMWKTWRKNRKKNRQKEKRLPRRNSLLFQDFQPGAENPTPGDELVEAFGRAGDDTVCTFLEGDEQQLFDCEETAYGDTSLIKLDRSLTYAQKFAFEELLSASQLVNIIKDGRLSDLETTLTTMIAQRIGLDWMNRPLDVKTGQFALHFAVNNGSVQIVDRFLEFHHIDVNVVQLTGRTPLIYAARDGNMGVLEALLAHKDIIVDHADNSNKTVRDFVC